MDTLKKILYIACIPVAALDFAAAIMVFVNDRDWVNIALFIMMGFNFLLEFVSIFVELHEEER
ncbi:hypothetical protein [Latilactobacillus sakei]|uniref:Uncharacterized protein n=1 Tax=Latilactobacillus sakei TaxID=1599 RepID=A0AAF0K3M1_LATSK|nr:hypothetical protein [Latilactobacillus sakei]WGI18571.1 hypothetical protein QBD03_07385 [Latilactobacillus sakei]